MSILIVDDDVEYVHYLSAVLGTEGHKPTLVYSGDAARKAIEEEKYSLILMDLALPQSSGMELIDVARKKDPLTVCITMTAFATVASAMEAIRQGAYDYLMKPTGMDVIKATIRRGLEHYELRKALVERTSQMERFKNENQHALELVHQVSSDLRNPLSVVYGFSSLLAENRDKMFNSEEMRKAIDFIVKNAETMRTILNVLGNVKPAELPKHDPAPHHRSTQSSKDIPPLFRHPF